jgi:NAD(P)H-dependent flavin oxidoreductase YrpB (nitropropane dioxygenase family)
MTTGFPTALTRLAGIDVPIVQAPIGGLARPELAAAVSNAGGLGMLSLTWSDPDVIDQRMRRVAALTARPVGVNLILAWPQADRLRRVLDHGARIVSFFWGDPAPLVPIVHAAGAIVTHSVGSVGEARRAADAGVDVIVAQGWEAGGHVRGEVATMALVPAVCDAVGPLPVVAAGGIADGRGMAAAIALGAAGVWLGTRFVMAAETAAHQRYHELLRSATAEDTVHSRLFDGAWPNAAHRTLRNSTVVAWEAAGRPVSDRPGEGDVIASVAGEPSLRYESASASIEVEGDVEAMSLWAGQSVGLIRDIEPAGDIVRRITVEARDRLISAAASVSTA